MDFIKRLRGKSAVYLFIIWLISITPILSLASFFYKKKKEKYLWRFVCLYSLRLMFFLGGLKIKVEGRKKNGQAYIYAANHLSALDGFIICSIVGFNITAITGPSDYFTWPFSLWFKKMAFIDVQRSEIEKEKFKDANSPGEAIKKALKELKSNHSILIFPEGHVTLEHRLLYFHTGPARISLAVDKKIIPVAIINTDKLVDKDIFFKSGNIKVIFGDPIDLVDYYVKHRANITEATEYLKEHIRNLLPNKYLSKSYGERNPEKTAVVLKVNHVLYDGDANLDFVYELWKRGSLKLPKISHLAWLYLVNKINKIENKDLLEASVKALEGKRVDLLYKEAKKIFEKKLKYNVNEKIVKLLIDHRKKGHQIILLTNVISPLAKCFADYIKAEHWLGSHLIENNRRYTGKLSDWIKIDQAEKAADIMKTFKLKPEQSFVYGHDDIDLELINLVRHRAIVNPEKDDDYLRKKQIEKINI
jgi:1-acyl-sn-glycerol-3-phosphate acyltransferase